MAAKLMACEPYKKNAYSEGVTFDIPTPTRSVTQDVEYDPAVSERKTPSKEWELDVRSLISTKKWLQNYGLKKNKISLKQILPTIGFKHSDDFDSSLKRPISSRYSSGLFSKIFSPSDGKTFNITCSRQMLKQLEGRLLQAIALYKRRLEWLTSESRRLFGVIEEKGVTIVLDIRNMSPQQFDQYKIALERVIFEQLTQVAKFNLIRAVDDLISYQEECVPVTFDTIQGAVDWVWSLDRLQSVSRSAACEAVLKAMADKNNEAVYLFTEGTSIDTCKEIMKEKVSALQRKIPVHCVSYNCGSSDTVRFLKDFAACTGGKFHAYAVIMEMDSYEGEPLNPRTNKANILLKKKTYGGVPPGSGMREDVIYLFEELEEAKNNLSQIQALMEEVPEPKIQLDSVIEKTPTSDTEEQYMSSKEWLKKFGLTARRLELYDVLAGVAFKHMDGVVDIKQKPDHNTQTDAVRRPKLMNAKYCDRFPVVRWKDGGVVHVQVTPEIHRSYEQRMNVAIQAFHQRVDWLNQGSRSLFGTVIEDQIYILVDTSSSMSPSIQFVKDKLFILMQEQLRHKMKFNLVAFNSKAISWQNRLVEVNEQSLKGAWKWIQGLSCWGSTNTYAALQFAISDPGTQAIYLLTDGRPDQPPRSIIAQVQMQHCVPVHTISFNCNDTEANQFLCDLARNTGGRYHYFSEKGKLDQDQPASWESEDIRLLKEEANRGRESLDKVEELRDECSNLSWKKEVESLKRCSRSHPKPSTDRLSAVPPLNTSDLYRSSTPPPPRPLSASMDSPMMSPAPPKQSRASSARRSLSSSLEFQRPKSASQTNGSKTERSPLSAKSRCSGKIRSDHSKTGHTRTSLLRTLNSSGNFSPEEWLLPETRQLFEKQAVRQKQLAIDETRKTSSRRGKSKSSIKPRSMSSKMWLSKHGLVAKKLTILDALAPTFVSHSAKYVPILDKHVVAKVFDEVLPLAHVSSRSKQKITLVNPLAVDLKGYEAKVQTAINLYKRRLDRIVWEALPQDTKDELGSDEPLSFENNRLVLMKALDTAGWPIEEADIILLEEEITRGNKFLSQADELRKKSSTRNSDEYQVSKKNKRKHSHRSRSSISSSGSHSSRSSSRSSSSSRSRSTSRSVSRKGSDVMISEQHLDVNLDDDLNVYDDKASVVSNLTNNTNQEYEVGHT